ncbi:MAG: hypothetical protein KDA96_21505 [Planctomycetaceae bacterium]|nr:hypothetical protein [Planctomycetaceae bacterium]
MSSRSKRQITLLSVVAGCCFLWGIVFPDIAARPDFQRADQEFERDGIDPTALFYTDHPRMYRSFEK